jgi:hypothetical protein
VHTLTYNNNDMLRVESPCGRIAFAVRCLYRTHWYYVRVDGHPQMFIFRDAENERLLSYKYALNRREGGRQRRGYYIDYFLKCRAFYTDGTPCFYST